MPRFAEEPGTLFFLNLYHLAVRHPSWTYQCHRSLLSTLLHPFLLADLAFLLSMDLVVASVEFGGKDVEGTTPPQKKESEHIFTIHLFKQPEIPKWMKNIAPTDYRQTCWTLQLSMWFWPKGICPMILCKGCSFPDGRLRFVCSWTSRLLL